MATGPSYFLGDAWCVGFILNLCTELCIDTMSITEINPDGE